MLETNPDTSIGPVCLNAKLDRNLRRGTT